MHKSVNTLNSSSPSSPPPSGGTPALEPERDTVAIPRPANELDGEAAFVKGRVKEEPDADPQKAG